ncbi:MAG: hypothetical protein HY900_00715 [Deltaproteobacteria bacterium]|nr:hypothetical protein [Deltaproteobacteria bacterium]
MWRIWGRGSRQPLPWWVQQTIRHTPAQLDQGLFATRHHAFASNAFYRYWYMIGVKDHKQECLIGQAGEVEPVYDAYCLSFFLFDPATRTFGFPQFPATGAANAVEHRLESGYLPMLTTTYRHGAYTVEQTMLATTTGVDQKAVALLRYRVRGPAGGAPVWFCLSASPAGPTGFQRVDTFRMQPRNRWLPYLRYVPNESRLDVWGGQGPSFDSPPQRFGMYGNGSTNDPDFYLDVNAYEEMRARASLNGWEVATDHVGGLCHGVLAWDVGANGLTLDVRLPIDDFAGPAGLAALRAERAANLETNNRNYWQQKLDGSGTQLQLPSEVAHLTDQYRVCRSTLLMLSDDGQIHPGPTIYDEFWLRDSSVEGIACALAGDTHLAQRQFGDHYTSDYIFNQRDGTIGPCSLRGFFGGRHEKEDREWDSNGQALWAFGRFDRILGTQAGFGAQVFSPYVVMGARWLRGNRSAFGLLHSGWSAEHVGDRDKPHYWDDFWAVAGLWEAARLGERLSAYDTLELWSICREVAKATADSIAWVLDRQREQGHWETFIPTGPANIGGLDSTMVGTLAYFHPCRLHIGKKLGERVDYAARCTLDTLWSHFVTGGLRHQSWQCFGPYLTLQLAHAFLYVGDIQRMDQCLGWCIHAGSASVHPQAGSSFAWRAALGAWNEQHCYPIASDFAETPAHWWYMGDIPHGWAAAELMLLLREILFFEADEDGDAHIFLAPGVMPHWVGHGETIGISDAPTVFGAPFGYTLTHDRNARTVEIGITQEAPGHVRYIYPCRFGHVVSAQANGRSIPFSLDHVLAPRGTSRITVTYAP